MEKNTSKLKEIHEILNLDLVKYEKNFKRIPELCEYGETVEEVIEIKNYCESWPFFDYYQQLNFLKPLKRENIEKIILQYALKRFLEFEMHLQSKKFSYTLYLYFDMDKDTFKKGMYIWPRIYFCRNKKYIGYKDPNLERPKAESKYKKYIKKLLKEIKMEQFFTIYELKDINSSFDDHAVFINFKKGINSL